MEFSNEEKNFLLKLARRSIKTGLSGENFSISEEEIKGEKLKEKLACFVTLEIDGSLRGCIGHLEPVQELYKDVIENAQKAAFQDPRFPALTPEEFEKIEIEISVLTLPEKFEYKSEEELLKYLQNKKPGVILGHGYSQATYLPSVWEQIPEPEEFLSQLCQKAGLPPSAWEEEIEIQTYETIKIS